MENSAQWDLIDQNDMIVAPSSNLVQRSYAMSTVKCVLMDDNMKIQEAIQYK